jgi:hypothetical protein
MKPFWFSTIRLACVALGFLLVTALAAPVQAGELKLEAQLIWGTNDEKSPDPKHKAVDARVAKKLNKLPFKWQHYFEVNRVQFSLAEDQTQKIELSKECKIKVRYLGKSNVEVQLYGKGELVSKISQSLTKDECLVTGGNAANLTAWFVMLRQVD